LDLLLFLVQVFVISFSGAMAPGPVSATVIAMGVRSPYAGLLVAAGHGIIEFPLMVLIMLGAGMIFESAKTQAMIGLAGGIFLLLMSVQIFIGSKNSAKSEAKTTKSRPILAGLILSAGNPYFLIWWVTIGLALATTAKGFGIWAFGLFAVVHWLCDCFCFQALSWASFKGTRLFGSVVERGTTNAKKSVWGPQRKLLLVCSMAVFLFGLKFIFDFFIALSR